MLFSFLIASVSAGPTNTDTTGVGPSPSPMINITNRCGVDGAVDHEFMVTLKPPAPNSNGRRLDTTQDKLNYLQGWVHQYDPEDTSNGTTRRKLEANSNSPHVLHLFAVTQLAVAISADDDVRHAQHAHVASIYTHHVASIFYTHSRTLVHASDHRAHGQGPGRLLN